MLELHIWGPAFGLPSIEPECIAAVAYLNRTIPNGEWTLYADHDTSLSPNRDFPALRGGDTWIAGFNSIVHYLRHRPTYSVDPDENLNPGQRADNIAYTSLLSQHAAPLLALTLYTTHANYYHCTSSAWTTILPPHLNYTIPPARRRAARALTAHLGLQGLDVEDVDDSPLGQPGSNQSISGAYASERKKLEAGARPGVIPLGKRSGVLGALQKPEYTTRFKLDALAGETLGPLNDLLGEKPRLLSDEDEGVTSLDCLALGYLSLMLYPPLPQPWLAETLRSKYPRLEAYIRRSRRILLGPQDVTATAVLSLNALAGDPAAVERARIEKGLTLPWTPPLPTNPLTTLLHLPQHLIHSLPGAGYIHHHAHIVPAHPPETSTALAPSTVDGAYRTPTSVLATFATFAAGLVSLVAGAAMYHVQTHREASDLVFVMEREKPAGFAAFGEAGAALAALSAQMSVEAEWARERERVGGERVVEVDVEIEGAKVGEL
ncbi:hypothetical protein H2201_007101 [Coniosporium apollinis]|uniref:Mitochondrial outer membrane transport complex Sam37/metaxin N-terminal domain-containing protein n=2 Tax=Coniosporium TaxID=2810619 RepID=A0ABQ9NK74_9PEZI|nr:hypothetical protein H2199_003992 [Cladosporium sp. JES 115]KAJ9659996.1 hypothetical protein H2201_007101 [Coniosporium apollinis]